MARVVFLTTFFLFIAGVVLQQQSIRSIQAAIRPSPTPIVTQSPVLENHFDEKKKGFYDKYLKSNRPKGGWNKAAYVQLVRNHGEVCNAVMSFATLEKDESLARRVLVYPESWDTDTEKSDKLLSRSKRLLKSAAERYQVLLQPAPGRAKVTEEQALYPLTHLLAFDWFYRILFLRPSGLLLDTSQTDRLFTLPMESSALAISTGTMDGLSEAAMLLIQPSRNNHADALAMLPEGDFSDRDYLSSVPAMTDFAEDQVSLLASTSSLKAEDEAFNATQWLGETAYVYFTDPDLRGPAFNTPQEVKAKARPRSRKARSAWEKVFETYRQQRMDICGLDLEAWPKPESQLVNTENPVEHELRTG